MFFLFWHFPPFFKVSGTFSVSVSMSSFVSPHTFLHVWCSQKHQVAYSRNSKTNHLIESPSIRGEFYVSSLSLHLRAVLSAMQRHSQPSLSSRRRGKSSELDHVNRNHTETRGSSSRRLIAPSRQHQEGRLLHTGTRIRRDTSRRCVALFLTHLSMSMLSPKISTYQRHKLLIHKVSLAYVLS